MDATSEIRWITLDGAVNVRDLGGLPTADGSRTVGGRLIRADNLQQLSAADVAELVGAHGVTRVVDLRSDLEVASEGPGPLAAVAAVEHVHHSMIRIEDADPESATDAGRARVMARAVLAERQRHASADHGERAARTYFGYLQDRPDSVLAALRAIAGTPTPGAALVHCAAGKDRTGVIVALALTTVGVPRAVVVADYLATATRIDALLARLRSSPTYTETVNQVSDAAHTPVAAGMRRFLELIDAEHGGPEQWLATHGFGPHDVHRLRVKLLEAPTGDRPLDRPLGQI